MVSVMSVIFILGERKKSEENKVIYKTGICYKFNFSSMF